MSRTHSIRTLLKFVVLAAAVGCSPVDVGGGPGSTVPADDEEAIDPQVGIALVEDSLGDEPLSVDPEVWFDDRGVDAARARLDTPMSPRSRLEAARAVDEVDAADASGPRPELRDYEAWLTPSSRSVAEVRAGIVAVNEALTTVVTGDPAHADLLLRLAFEYAALRGAWAHGEQIHPDGAQAVARRLSEMSEASAAVVRTVERLEAHPSFDTLARADEAYFVKAVHLGYLGRTREMQRAYQHLITQYPNSAFISRAYLSFSDYYFDRGELGNAIRLYEKVIQFRDSPAYAYGLYKLAWSHMGGRGEVPTRADKALNYFVHAIQASNEGRAGSAERARALRRAARADLVHAYVEVAKPSKAWAAFGKWGVGPQGEDERVAMMEHLGRQYFERSQHDGALVVYDRLLRERPDHAHACDWRWLAFLNGLGGEGGVGERAIEARRAALERGWSQGATSTMSAATQARCADHVRDAARVRVGAP